MDELIRRLEETTEGGRELDFLIFEATHDFGEFFDSPVESWSRDEDGIYTINTRDGFLHLGATHAPNYTTSIDAALALIPKGMGRYIWAGEGAAQVTIGILGWDWGPHISPKGKGEAKTEPLALCIAALRAHQATKDTGHE